MQHVIIYCDGACLKNPGPGGYAGLLMLKEKPLLEKVVRGAKKNTTNNQMELMAAIESLKTLKKPCKVELFSDSQYVIKGMTEWIFTWQKNNFMNSHKKPVLNKELWQELFSLSKIHEIKWVWVKGHAGNKYNEIVDEIAKEEAVKCLYMS